MQQTVLYGDFPKRLQCSGTLVLCIKGHASAGHRVVCIAMDQMVAIAGPPGRQYWGARMSTSAANHRFTIPPTGCVHLDALWCGLCTRWPVPYFLTGSTLRRP